MLILSQLDSWPRPRRNMYFPVAPEGSPSCGMSTADFEPVTSGDTAPERAWPWFALIGAHEHNRTYLCGGTLLSAQWILTAAHCLKTKMGVLLGSVRKLQTFDNFTVGRKVLKKFGHRQYNKTGLNPHAFDIALLQLDAPVTFTPLIQPACLPANLTEDGFRFIDCYLTGYGFRQKGERALPQSMQELKVKLMDHAKCTKYWRHFKDHQMCAEFNNNPQAGSCRGDSGGPLSCIAPGRPFFITGIVSGGNGTCERRVKPDFYVNVAYFKDWILKTIKDEVGSLPPPLDGSL
ncbi:chymotrypsin-like elastase family member 2a [Plakobranchus ocellatus]|uniref:Chymotrypsin-like elastase family member 2a n=1 Tax=Plakobranchus ocellatus TaxID=259542 RepID=A0AAV4D6Y1_9GAST|nr:chymotrypsin-like elastase family member 2a [Plakobranchus ocellatus]